MLLHLIPVQQSHPAVGSSLCTVICIPATRNVVPVCLEACHTVAAHHPLSKTPGFRPTGGPPSNASLSVRLRPGGPPLYAPFAAASAPLWCGADDPFSASGTSSTSTSSLVQFEQAVTWYLEAACMHGSIYVSYVHGSALVRISISLINRQAINAAYPSHCGCLLRNTCMALRTCNGGQCLLSTRLPVVLAKHVQQHEVTLREMQLRLQGQVSHEAVKGLPRGNLAGGETLVYLCPIQLHYTYEQSWSDYHWQLSACDTIAAAALGGVYMCGKLRCNRESVTLAQARALSNGVWIADLQCCAIARNTLTNVL
jgi:hypothetical protein